MVYIEYAFLPENWLEFDASARPFGVSATTDESYIKIHNIVKLVYNL